MMMVKPPKKLLPLLILDVLRNYTDAEHQLSQKEILDILKKEYDMTADRKAIRRNIGNLMDMGYPIEYTETVRMMRDPQTGEMEESVIISDLWMEREFSDGELRLLIDSILFSNHIPPKQCKELMGKLENLSSKYFKAHMKHIHTMPAASLQNPQLFYTIETLDEAISAGKKVAFSYLEYGMDKKQHPRRTSDGAVREYLVSPYQMAAKEGKYYLICNHDKYDDVSNYRVDRIANIRLLEEYAKPFSALRGADGKRLDLATYMAEHIYMFSSETVRVKFRIVKAMVSDVMDMFGSDVVFSDESDTHVTVTAKVNKKSMEQFAKNYAPDVIVLEPKAMADAVRENAKRIVRAYQE